MNRSIRSHRFRVGTLAVIALASAATAGAAPRSHGDGRNQSPDLSPDGTKILFVSNRGAGGEIWSMNVDGSGPVNLTPSEGPNSQAVYSPDGRRIAFTSGRDGDWNIYVMNADGSGHARVTRNPADEFAPTWSPDGSRIAFYRRNAERQRSEIATTAPTARTSG